MFLGSSDGSASGYYTTLEVVGSNPHGVTNFFQFCLNQFIFIFHAHRNYRIDGLYVIKQLSVDENRFSYCVLNLK